MRLFAPMYDMAMRWSAHRHAPRYLAVLGFAEASFFPVPPDVMLAPMTLARPESGWRYAVITTLASVVGGVFGYMIGFFAFDLIEPVLHSIGYWDTYMQIREWFISWGIWIIFLAGFTPIPYKLFTITAGVMSMSLLPFILASIVGRGARFFLVVTFMRWGGQRMDALMRRYVERLGWVVIVAAIIAYVLIKT